MAGVGSSLVPKRWLMAVIFVLLKQQVLLVLASTLSSKVWKSANNCKIRTTAGHSHVYHYQRICINMLFCTETCMKCVWKLFHSKRQCYDKVIVPSEEFSQYPAIMCKMLAVYECIHGYSLLQTVYRPQQITNKCNRLAYIVWWITVAIITLLFVCLVFFFFFFIFLLFSFTAHCTEPWWRGFHFGWEILFVSTHSGSTLREVPAHCSQSLGRSGNSSWIVFCHWELKLLRQRRSVEKHVRIELV